MARDFSGSGQFASRSGAVLSAVPLAMAGWVKVDSLASARVLCWLGDAAASTWRAFYIAIATDGSVSATTAQNNSFAGATATSVLTTGAWRHVAGIFPATNSRAAYLDGGNKGTNTTSMTPTGIDSVYLGCDSSGFGAAQSNFHDGQLAEWGVWDLTSWGADAASRLAAFEAVLPALASGRSPWDFQLGLAAYWPLHGTQSPEPDYHGGTFPLTVTGATRANHAPVEPWSRRSWSAGAMILVEESPDIPSGSGTISAVGSLLGAGQATQSGSGIISAIGTLTGTGGVTVSGSGTITAIASLTGAGTHVASGSGQIDATGTLAGVGSILASGTGQVEATGTLTGVGYTATAGSGLVDAIGSLVGAGHVIATGSGSIAAIGSLTGTGQHTATGTGEITAVGTLSGVGDSGGATGSGSIIAAGSLTGVGSVATSGTGSVLAVGSLAGVGQIAASGTGQIAAVGSLTGVGQAPSVDTASGSGVISAVGSLVGVGQVSVSGSGSLIAAGLLLGFGHIDVVGSGEIAAIGRLTGIGLSSVPTAAGAPRGSGVLRSSSRRAGGLPGRNPGRLPGRW